MERPAGWQPQQPAKDLGGNPRASKGADTAEDVWQWGPKPGEVNEAPMQAMRSRLGIALPQRLLLFGM